MGTIINDIPIFANAYNCDNLDSFHIFHLKSIVDCLEDTDRNLNMSLDATNSVFFSEIDRLERIINDTRK